MYSEPYFNNTSIFPSCSNIIAITNRHCCNGDFLTQIRKIASKNPKRLILREKYLTDQAYLPLAQQCIKICQEYHVPFSINGRVEIASKISVSTGYPVGIHLPFQRIGEIAQLSTNFEIIGVSVHKTSEAIAAWTAGADYLIAGHIFTTDCKPGIPPKGLQFLKEICNAVPIPVYGIGGITFDLLEEIFAQGAAGGCMMSGLMKMY